MRNAKLRSGESGVESEVLKDWTTITSATDILAGTVISVLELNGCILEFKGVQGSENGIALRFKTAAGVSGSSGSSQYTLQRPNRAPESSPNTFTLIGGGSSIVDGHGSAEFGAFEYASLNYWLAGFKSEFMTLNRGVQLCTGNTLSEDVNNTLTAFTQVVVSDTTPDASYPFKMTYRIIRKN